LATSPRRKSNSWSVSRAGLIQQLRCLSSKPSEPTRNTRGCLAPEFASSPEVPLDVEHWAHGAQEGSAERWRGMLPVPASIRRGPTPRPGGTRPCANTPPSPTAPNASTPPRQMPDRVDAHLGHATVTEFRAQLYSRSAPEYASCVKPSGEFPWWGRTYRFLRDAFFLVAFFLAVFFPPAAFLSLAISATASRLSLATSAAAFFLAAASCFFSAAASRL
jgi:hypothetical protein